MWLARPPKPVEAHKYSQYVAKKSRGATESKGKPKANIARRSHDFGGTVINKLPIYLYPQRYATVRCSLLLISSPARHK